MFMGKRLIIKISTAMLGLCPIAYGRGQKSVDNVATIEWPSTTASVSPPRGGHQFTSVGLSFL